MKMLVQEDWTSFCQSGPVISGGWADRPDTTVGPKRTLNSRSMFCSITVTLIVKEDPRLKLINNIT